MDRFNDSHSLSHGVEREPGLIDRLSRFDLEVPSSDPGSFRPGLTLAHGRYTVVKYESREIVIFPGYPRRKGCRMFREERTPPLLAPLSPPHVALPGLDF